jgi:hypothetical protein
MIWLFWLTFFSILSEGNRFMSDQPEAKIINMKAQAKLIQEARDARAKRKADRENPQFPGGIDDMELS